MSSGTIPSRKSTRFLKNCKFRMLVYGDKLGMYRIPVPSGSHTYMIFESSPAITEVIAD